MTFNVLFSPFYVLKQDSSFLHCLENFSNAVFVVKLQKCFADDETLWNFPLDHHGGQQTKTMMMVDRCVDQPAFLCGHLMQHQQQGKTS